MNRTGVCGLVRIKLLKSRWLRETIHSLDHLLLFFYGGMSVLCTNIKQLRKVFDLCRA